MCVSIYIYIYAVLLVCICSSVRTMCYQAYIRNKLNEYTRVYIYIYIYIYSKYIFLIILHILSLMIFHKSTSKCLTQYLPHRGPSLLATDTVTIGVVSLIYYQHS